jgi:hypothetical protein
MKLTFGIKNAEVVRKGLEDLEAEVPKISRRRIYDAMNRITRVMEAYPAERPGQKYKRTGRLGFSWKVKRIDTGYILSSDARDPKTNRRYTTYVVGNAYGLSQAWMHRGRWPLFRDVVEAEVDRLPQQVADSVDLVSRRIFSGGAA